MLIKCKVCGKETPKLNQHDAVCSVLCRFVQYTVLRGEDECWEWSGPKNVNGYGVIWTGTNVHNKRMSERAHRFSYVLQNKTNIGDKDCVMHSCDNPSCVNPKHLSVGTFADNNRDRSKKNRSGARVFSAEDLALYSERYVGEGNPSAKLSENEVIDIKYNIGLSSSKTAEIFNVSKTTIKNIRSGKSWSHL